MRVRTIAASLLLLTAAALGATQVQGQGSAGPAFEVASVKLSNPDPSSPLSTIPLILPSPGGRLASTATLRSLFRGDGRLGPNIQPSTANCPTMEEHTGLT